MKVSVLAALILFPTPGVLAEGGPASAPALGLQATKPKGPKSDAPWQAYQTSLRELLAKLDGDLIVAKARWDAAWVAGVRQTPKTALDNLGECCREFMAVTQRRADLESRFATAPDSIFSAGDKAAILDGLMALERIARSCDDANFEYRVAPAEGGPTEAIAEKTWREQRERLIEGMRETEGKLRGPEWMKEGFDEAVSPRAWSVELLARFHALPDLELDVPSVGIPRPGSPLQARDGITGLRHAGDAAFTSVNDWAAIKAFYLANVAKPGGFELRVVRAGKELTAVEPVEKGAA